MASIGRYGSVVNEKLSDLISRRARFSSSRKSWGALILATIFVSKSVPAP
jgi:hypothetical protein